MWFIIFQVFPASLREIGSGSTSCFGFLMFFLVVKTSPILISTLDISGAFAIYGIVALTGMLFLYFCLPETMNKPLQEIEDDMIKRITSNSTNDNYVSSDDNIA